MLSCLLTKYLIQHKYTNINLKKGKNYVNTLLKYTTNLQATETLQSCHTRPQVMCEAYAPK